LSRNKTATAIALIMLLAVSSALAFLPSGNAVTYESAAFVSAQPSPIGVGQTAVIIAWLDNLPPKPGAHAGYYEGNFENFTITIEDPNGHEEEHLIRYADAVASAFITYTPDIVGTYTVTFDFPGQYGADSGPNADLYYTPSSASVHLEVQEEPLPNPTTYALPTGYWQRPINAEFRTWWPISGNWLQSRYNASGSCYNPYTEAPLSPHILWVRQDNPGGLIGGGDHEIHEGSYYTGHTYEKKFSNSIIIDGKLYYHVRKGSSAYLGTVCIDIRTGEELWFQEDITVDFGSVLEFESPNQHGGIPYLWDSGSTTYMYDAWTGELITTYENCTTGSYTYDERGNLLWYVLNAGRNYLLCWNATKAMPRGSGISWRPSTIADWQDGIEWNVTIPDTSTNPRVYFLDNDMIWARGTGTNENGYKYAEDVGYSLKPGSEGQQMWIHNRTGDEGRQGSSISKGRMGCGYMVEFIVQTLKLYGYSMATGAKVWESDPMDDPYSQYTSASTGTIIADNKVYRQSYDGKIRCYDITNGDLLWTWYQGDSGLDSVYPSYPFYQDFGGGGGQVVGGNMEHSPGSPIPDNFCLSVVDAETGNLTWQIDGAITECKMADGVLVGINNYQNQIFAFGKGRSETTVESLNPVSTLGDSVLVTGTVTDQSPGMTLQGMPAAGTPAISDDNMREWMEYLYEQKPMPTDATGVEVTITVLDPNGNVYEVATATSDINGMFKTTFDPLVSGLYTVIATFGGSNSYYGSCGETAINVMEATVTPAPTPTPAPMTDTYVLGLGAAAIIAIVIVGLVIILMLRRR
jgi:outer membrane protein assembly factor BamB